MATETRAAHGSDVDRVVIAAFRELALLAGTVVWTAFWLNVARLHLVAESTVDVDLANAAFVAGTLVLPAVTLYLWHLGSRLPVETPDAPLDGGPLGDATNG